MLSGREVYMECEEIRRLGREIITRLGHDIPIAPEDPEAAAVRRMKEEQERERERIEAEAALKAEIDRLYSDPLDEMAHNLEENKERLYMDALDEMAQDMGEVNG